jgi:hypothetical protein
MIEDYLENTGNNIRYARKYENIMHMFGSILRDLDKWDILPFSRNEPYTDFSSTEYAFNAKAFKPELHLDNPNFNGFVKLDSTEKISDYGHFIPNIGYLIEGNFRYLQDKNSESHYIKSLFFKEDFHLYVKAAINPHDNTKNMPFVTNVIKETFFVTHDNYGVAICQQEKLFKMSINPQEFALKRSNSDNAHNPLIGLEFRGAHYDYFLNMLKNNSEAFWTMRNMVAAFTTAKLTPNSKFIELIGEKDIIPSFCEAVMICKHLSARNNLNYS